MQNILSRSDRTKHPIKPKYRCRNSFPRLFLSPCNPSLSILHTQLYPIETDYIHNLTHTRFYLDFPHKTNNKTPRDTKSVNNRNKSWCADTLVATVTVIIRTFDISKSKFVKYTVRRVIFYVIGCNQQVKPDVFLGCKLYLNLTILRNYKIHINRQALR